jgi:hypothetical protein
MYSKPPGESSGAFFVISNGKKVTKLSYISSNLVARANARGLATFCIPFKLPLTLPLK